MSVAKLRAGGLGILGGTFNPPHVGHLAVARHAQRQLVLERVLLMPAGVSPHKQTEEDPGVEHRVAMCRLAVAEDPFLGVCTLEAERPGPSYTVDTMRAIHAQDPRAGLAFIVGADLARTLPAWHEPGEILALVGLVVAEREGTARREILQALAPLGAGERVRFLDMGVVDVSSSCVRERVGRGALIEEQVGPAVARYIAEHGLYRESSGMTST